MAFFVTIHICVVVSPYVHALLSVDSHLLYTMFLLLLPVAAPAVLRRLRPPHDPLDAARALPRGSEEQDVFGLLLTSPTMFAYC